MKQFEEHVGMTHYIFRRLSDRYQIPFTHQGNAKMVEVKPTIRTLATIPGIEMLMSVRGLELIRRVQIIERSSPNVA